MTLGRTACPAEAGASGDEAPPQEQAKTLPPAARLPDGTGRRRSRHHPRRHGVRRQRADVRRRVHAPTCSTPTARQARAREPHQPLGEHAGDGVYDKHTVFVDASCCRASSCRSTPTASSPTRPNSHDVVKWTDTNGDGVADRREVFYTGVGSAGRQPRAPAGGFHLGLDNWIYSTYNAFRFRWTPDRHSPRADRAQRRPVGPHAG
jgi:hypothetical protein